MRRLQNRADFYFFCTLFALFSMPLFSEDNTPGDRGNEFDALRAWIATKRQVTVKERGGNLSLSGDVRVDYIAQNEIKNGFKNIGQNSLNPLVAGDQFNVTYNMMLDYRTDATWTSIKARFSNIMGLVGGTQNRLILERAFMGFRLYEGDHFTIDIEPGRRKLSYSFDSRIQFASYMDGLLVKYSQSSDRAGDLYVYGGPFIVNQSTDQFAYIMELGILNIYNTGLYWKYSFIDWNTKHYHNYLLNWRYQFFNNQFILGYKFVPPLIKKVTTFYSAFLINSAAHKHVILNYKRDNIAWYAGLSMGEAKKRGDWAFDTNVQYVQPQAVPDFDLSGIGHGNSDSVGLYTINIDGTGAATTRTNAVGKANYFGWVFEFLYLLTDNLTIIQSFKYSHTLHFLPTQYSFKQYRLEFVYAW